MRILWLAPWFRTLGVAWAEGLRALGHDVVVVTTDQHYDAPELAEDDIVLRDNWRTRAGMKELVRARSRVRGFKPEAVVVEQVRDPRFLALAMCGAPVALTVHDAVPHDEANAMPFMRKANKAVLDRRARVDVVFSEHVRRAIGRRRHPTVVIPLTSEMPERLTPAFVEPEDRRDFLVVGRLSRYKNVETIVAAYERHRTGPGFRGDSLVLVGGGDPETPLPAHVEWVRGRFRFGDLAPRLAAAKASVCLYSSGSQSGVQVLSLQCGTACIVSDVGGLPEYLPDGEAPLGARDVEALAAMFDELADPQVSYRRGASARAIYERRYSVASTSLEWEALLGSLVG